MKRYTLRYDRGAVLELASLTEYVVENSGVTRARAFAEQIKNDCQSLCLAPFRGTARPDLGPGVRLMGAARGRVSVTFFVRESEIIILSILYAGRQR